jgi:tetratricopeptide (TPR) repeat protein
MTKKYMTRHARIVFRSALRAIALGLLILIGSAAPATRALAEDDYESIVAEAVAEFQRQNWIEARALFKRAHEIRPNARTLRGAGIAAFEAKLYVDAYQDLTAALASKVKPLTATQRTDAQRILARTSTFIARVRISVEPNDAELSIDGKSGVMEDGVTLLDPGVHDLVARASGYESANQRLDAEPGDKREIQIELRSLQESEAAAPAREITPAQLEAKPTPQAPKSKPNDFGVWPWVAAGAAVAFAGTGVALHLASNAAASDVKDACPLNKCTLAQIDKRIDDGHIKTFDTLKIVAWSLAGAAAATSVVLFVLDGSGGEAQPQTAVRVGPGSVAIRGTF